MAQTKLNMLLQMRRVDFTNETNAAWKPAQGEPCFCTVKHTFKVGDGKHTWAELPFANRDEVVLILENYYTKSETDALIKAVDDKVVALNDTFATDAEVEGIRKALADAIDLKLDKTTYNAYVEAHQSDYTNTQIDAKFNPYRTSADQDAIDATFALKTDVENEFKNYTTTTAQQAIDAEQDRRIGVLEAKPFDTYATKTEVQGVAGDLSDYETANDARVKAIEDEIDGFNYADATETANALNDRYTKAEADAAFTTPAEVIAEVNKALSEVSNADTIENISTLVNYVNENAADLTGLITEVYGSAEMTGDSRLDTIEAKAAMGITSDDIQNWNTTKSTVDANKTIWDKADTALQAKDLADYAKTADVVTNGEFTAFEATNTEAINAKLDKSTFEAFNNGASKNVAAIEADIVAKAGAAESAAKGYADSLNTAMDARVIKLENNDAGYATKTYVDTQDADILAQARAYVDGKEHKNTTYTVAATTNVLEFTVTPSEGSAQTVKLVAPNTGVMEVAAGNDIVVTPGENGKVTVAHETFVTGEYTKTPNESDKTGDQYFFTGVTVDNGHVTGANVKSLASVLEAMSFILDGGTSIN